MAETNQRIILGLFEVDSDLGAMPIPEYGEDKFYELDSDDNITVQNGDE